MSATVVFPEFGSIVSARSGIVDIWFERAPPIYTLLGAGEQGKIAARIARNAHDWRENKSGNDIIGAVLFGRDQG